MDKTVEGSLKAPPLFPSQRLVVGVVLFLGDFVMHLMRNILSLGIVCMIRDQHDNSTNTEPLQLRWHPGSATFLVRDPESSFRSEDSCSGNLTDAPRYSGEFAWDSSLQGVLLSSFAYGYTGFMLFGGFVVTRFGARRIIFIFMSVASMLTLLSPLAASTDPYLLVAVEAVKGIFIAPYFPATYFLWSRWAVDEERTLLMNIAGTGGTVASVAGNIVTGYLCQYVGWESIFYLYGSVSFAWCLLFFFTVWNKPSDNPRISQRELAYMERELGDRGVSQERIRFSAVPWRKILTCRTVWAVNVGSACWAFGSIIQGRMIPSFLDDVLKLDIVENGLYSALPQLTGAVVTLLSSAFADWLIRRGLRIIVVRKLMWGSGLISAAVVGCFVGYLGCAEVALAVFVLCLWVGVNALANSGAFLTQLEHAPRYSALIMGVCNFAGNIPGIFTPSVIKALTPNGTQAEWRVTFFIAGAAYIAGAFVFIALGEDGIANWAREDDDVPAAKTDAQSSDTPDAADAHSAKDEIYTIQTN